MDGLKIWDVAVELAASIARVFVYAVGWPARAAVLSGTGVDDAAGLQPRLQPPWRW